MTQTEEIAHAIQQLAGVTDTDHRDIIDCLTTTCFDRETAGQIERILSGEYYEEV